MKEKLTIVKVGGKVVEEQDTLCELLHNFEKIGGLKMLVHGGGRSATKMCEKLGIETQMVDGRRITDIDTLKVVTMVYGGLVNKNIVAKLQAMGVDSIGLTGADLDIIRSVKRPLKNGIDYGYVGDVIKVDDLKLYTLIKYDLVPVVAPLTHDGAGNLLNTNADTIASSLAKGLASSFDVELVFCFEKKGVLSDEKDDESVISRIDKLKFEQLKADEIVTGGMIPKLENAFDAINSGVKSVVITSSEELGKGTGTMVVQ